MDRYLILTSKGYQRIVYGDYFKAVRLSVKGSKIITIPNHVDDDDINFGRISYSDLCI